MDVVIVLAMHGAPPQDLPKRKIGEFFSLHMQLEWNVVPEERRPMIESRYAELEKTICSWPRTEQNDPFYTASHELADQLSLATGYDVVVGFNEFCTPSLDDALDQAVMQEADRVIVVTPMMTPGGEHAEIDIPTAIDDARQRHPDVDFRYAWPFDMRDVAKFLREQIARHT
jgi:sirohydrochlorin cobaltochelatase